MLYYYVSTSAVPPSVEGLKAGTGAVASGSLAADESTENIAITGLTASTNYYSYFYQEIGGRRSAISESGVWTTAAATGTSFYDGRQGMVTW